MNRIDVVRACYDAYVSGDQTALQQHLAPDLMFYSPPDPGLDRAAYFERCWPNAHLIQSYEFERLIEAGDEVVVTYESEKADGSRFRNTEVFTFDGDQISRIEVYFGWTVR